MSAFRSFVSVRAAIGAFVLVAASTLGITAPAAAGAANTTTIDVTIGSCDIRGGGGPWNGKVKIEWRTADGTLRDLETADSSVTYWGNDIACYDYGYGVEPGDTIKTTVKGVSRTFTVPPLTVRVDRTTNVVIGTTKPNSRLFVTLDGRGPGTHYYWQQRDARSHADGTYAVDFDKGDKADIRGLDDISVSWTNARGDYVRSSAVAPGVRVTIGRPYVEAAGQPGFDATLKLLDKRDGSIVAKTGGMVFAGLNGFLWLDAHGDNVRAAEGNKVVTDLAADASFVIPTLTTTINKKTDVVRLATGLGAGVGVYFELRSTNCASWANTDTDASGSVVVDFTGTDEMVQYCDFGQGDWLSITVRLASGDEITKVVVVE